MNDSSQSNKKSENHVERLKMWIVGSIGLLLPFLASIPPITAWGALMTVPFLMYLVLLMTNLNSTVIYPPDVFNIVSLLLALLLLAYSAVYLWRKKSIGLVTTGPYRIVRHPQYFSIIIFTTVVTFQSIWTLQHTFGIGWLSVEETLILWIAMLLAYVVIATIEELHLQDVYASEWTQYRKRVGFLLPLVHTESRIVEAIVCLILPILILYGLLYVT